MEDESDDTGAPADWRLTVAEEIGALRERTRTNRERIIGLEDEVGVDPPTEGDEEVMGRLEDIEQMIEKHGVSPEVTGFWSWANQATSTSQKLVGTVTFLIIVVVLILILASNDISLSSLSGEAPYFAVTGRLVSQLVRPYYVQETDPGKAQKHNHDRI